MADVAIETLMDEREVARFLHCSVALVRRWRRLKTGPPFRKIGVALVRYSPIDLRDWVNAQPVGGGPRQ